jgi:ATP-dependent exoDNAse (exonuclease V) beta subunit
MNQQAPFPFSQHTLIRASAGSGKTFSLGTQFIALLNMGVDPTSILATTFTRKAAGEILGKMLERLAHAAMDQSQASKVARDIRDIKEPAFTSSDANRLLQVMCQSLHRVNVSTLDAFFSRLAGSFRLELDLPLDPAMVATSDPQAVRARSEAIEAMLSANDPDVMVGMLRRVHHDQTTRSVTQAIDQIISQLHETYRMSPDKAVWSMLQVPKTLEGDNLKYAIEKLEAILKTDLDKRLATSLQKSLDAALNHDWEEFISKGIPGKLLAGETEFYKKPIEQDVIDAITPLNIHAKADRVGRIAKQTIATWELLESFDAHYDAVRRSHRLLTFSDLPLKLANEVAPTSDHDSIGLDTIYYRLDGQVQHLLLDEFQDTSPLQWKVLKPIAQEIVNHADQDRSFFCVGDIKQSIYSWRGGCPELFDQLTNDLVLQAKSIEELNTSYRTSQAVLDVVNHIFTKLPGCELVTSHKSDVVKEVVTKFQSAYIDHKAELTRSGLVKLVTSGNELDASAEMLLDDLALDFDDDLDDDFISDDTDYSASADDDEQVEKPSSKLHTRFVARYIARLVRQHPKRSLGVLVRTNAMVSQLIHLLQKNGINASGEGGNPVTDDPAVELVLAALQLSDHPGDSVARYHVQRSALASVIGLVDLSLESLEAFSHQVRDVISKQGYAALLSQWADRLSLFGNVRSATRLGQLIELAQAYEIQATSRPGDFVAYVKATPVEEPMPAAVRVMTVHKAKGLEFDVVVLPELHSVLGRMQRQLSMIYRPKPTDNPAAIYRYANEKTRKLSGKLQKAYEQEVYRRLSDDLCALYVAMTRPHHALHLIIPPLGLTEKGKIKAAGLTNLSPASILRNLLPANFQEEPELAQELYTTGDEHWDKDEQALSESKSFDEDQPQLLPELLKLDLPTAGDPSRSWRVIAPSNLEADQRVRVGDLLRLASADGRAFGSLIHAMFEQIQWLDEPLPESQIKQIIRTARQHVPQATKDQTASAAAYFKKMLAKPAIIKALSQTTVTKKSKAAAHIELWRERPFAVRIEGALVNGILDRVMVYRDSNHVAQSAAIVDFKTDRLDNSLAPDTAVEQIVARYRPQMQAYCKALASMLDLPIDAIDAHLLLLGSAQLAQAV